MKKVILLLVVAITFSSCATLFTGTKDTIRFTTDPPGATVYKDGLELCRTPCSVPIERDIQGTDIEIRLDGYQTRVFTLDQEFNVVSILNLGNLLGWGVDILTGSVMRYDRKSYDIQLDPDTMASIGNAKEIRVNTENMTVDVYVVE